MEKFPMVKLGKKRLSEETKAKVCYVCGHRGFSDLLIYCSECSKLAVHKYCWGIIPGSIDDDDDFYWACECCYPLMGSGASTLQMSGALVIQSVSETVLAEDQPKSLCSLLTNVHHGSSDLAEQSTQSHIVERAVRAGPMSTDQLLKDKAESKTCVLPCMEHPVEIRSGVLVCDKSIRENQYSKGYELYDYTDSQIAEETPRSASLCMNHLVNHREALEAHVSSFMECPKELMSGVVLLVSPSGEVIISSGMNSCDGSHSPEAPVSSYMEYPKEIMNGLVLLASPSGEVIIRSMSISDDSHAPSLTTSILDMASSSDEDNTPLDKLCTKLGPVDGKAGLPECKRARRKRRKIAVCHYMSYPECKRARRKRRKI